MEKTVFTAPETEIVEFETMADPIVTSNTREAEELPVIVNPDTNQ